MNQRVKEKNKWIDRLINFVFYGCVLALIWLLLQITTFSSFRIPTASMHPTLIKGDYVIVNKWIAGGRIFNVLILSMPLRWRARLPMAKSASLNNSSSSSFIFCPWKMTYFSGHLQKPVFSQISLRV